MSADQDDSIGRLLTWSRATFGGRLHDLELRDGRVPKPRHFREPLRRSCDNLGERTEFFQQGLGQRLHVPARQRAKQNEFQ